MVCSCGSKSVDDQDSQALGRALMWLRSSDIITAETAREVSGRAEARARSKPGVFAFGSAFR
jgi:hypothetical protein